MCDFGSGNDWKNRVQSSNSGGEKHFVPNHDLTKCPEDPNPKRPNLNDDPVIGKPMLSHPIDNCFPDCSRPTPNLCFPGKLSDPSPTPQATLEVQVTNYSEHDLHNNLGWDVGNDEDLQEFAEVNLNDSFLSSFNLDNIFVSESIDVHDEQESGYSSSDSCISVSCSEQKLESEVLAFSEGFDCSLLSFGNISYLEFPLCQNS